MMAFCTNCGQPVQVVQKFCATCGAQVQPPATGLNQTVPSAAPPSMPIYQNVTPPAPVYRNPEPVYYGETVKFVLPDIWITNSSRIKETYTLIVSERRSIFARRIPEIQNDVLSQARAKVEAKHKGFFGKWAAFLNGANDYAEHYKNFTPDQILQETQGNFAIDNSTILKIRIEVYNLEDAATGEYYGFKFQTVTGDLNFYSTHNHQSTLKLCYGKDVVK
jgi:hypothetical protein